MKELISVVVPVYNEVTGISKFLNGELLPVLADLKEDAEIVIVDDGSTDNSLEIVKKIGDSLEVTKNSEVGKNLETAKNSKTANQVSLRIVALMKNFGKEIALTAGLREARGDAVIMIDADGQHPANEISRMLEKWHAGAKIVTAIRGQNTTKHRLGSRLYYSVMKMAGDKNSVRGSMDFRLMDREVVDEFNRFTEHNRLTRGLIDWLGYPQEYIKVETKNRSSGKPTYKFRKLVLLAGDSMVSASRTPLIIFGYIGIFIMVITFIPGVFQLVQEYILGDPLHLEWGGGVAVSLFVAFLVGLVLISQAMTALYVSQIHAEAKNRPLYIINKSKSVGLNEKQK